MFTELSGFFFRLAPIAALAGANVLAGPVYHVTELHADSGYSPADLNLAALFFADFYADSRHDADAPPDAPPDAPVFAEISVPETPWTGLAERATPVSGLSWTVDPTLAMGSEEVFYTAGFAPDDAYLFRSTGDAGETVRFTCDRSPGGFAITLCLTAGSATGDSSPESPAKFHCALYGHTGSPPAYIYDADIGDVPAKIAASHADRSR
jgi:hypothetical protein